MVNYRKAVYLQLNSLISKIALKSFFSSHLYLFWIWELFFKGIIIPLLLTKNGWSNLHSAVNMPSSGEPGSKVSLRTAWPKDTVSSWLTNLSPSEPYLCERNTRPIRKVSTHQLRMSLLNSPPKRNCWRMWGDLKLIHALSHFLYLHCSPGCHLVAITSHYNIYWHKWESCSHLISKAAILNIQ